jgi:hypothetical protein
MTAVSRASPGFAQSAPAPVDSALEIDAGDNELSRAAPNTAHAYYFSMEYKANDLLTIKETASWRQTKRDIPTPE